MTKAETTGAGGKDEADHGRAVTGDGLENCFSSIAQRPNPPHSVARWYINRAGKSMQSGQALKGETSLNALCHSFLP